MFISFSIVCFGVICASMRGFLIFQIPANLINAESDKVSTLFIFKVLQARVNEYTLQHRRWQHRAKIQQQLSLPGFRSCHECVRRYVYCSTCCILYVTIVKVMQHAFIRNVSLSGIDFISLLFFLSESCSARNSLI